MQRHTSVVTLRDMFLLLCTLSVIANARGSTNMTDEVLHTEDDHCQSILVNGELMPTEPEYMPSFPVSLKGITRHFVCKLSAPKTNSTTPSTTLSPTTFESTTTQDTTTMSTTESTTSHPITTTQSTTTQDTTTMSTTESTTSHPTTTTQSAAKIFVTDRDTQYKIFVADLQNDLYFTDIPSTEKPGYITYDSVEKKIYWTDTLEDVVYRADEDGGNRERLTHENGYEPQGIAIAESSRILYIAYRSSMEITSVDIGQGSAFPSSGANFVTTTFDPDCLEVDEEQGFLYWSVRDKILRKPLNESGSTETVYSNVALSRISGLSIDLSRDPRRIFFCDYREERSFYKDVHTTMAHELTEYMSSEPNMRDISYFNGTLYWTKYDKPSAIAVMTEYDQSSPSFDIKETSAIEDPYQLLIIN